MIKCGLQVWMVWFGPLQAHQDADSCAGSSFLNTCLLMYEQRPPEIAMLKAANGTHVNDMWLNNGLKPCSRQKALLRADGKTTEHQSLNCRSQMTAVACRSCKEEAHPSCLLDISIPKTKEDPFSKTTYKISISKK